MTFMVNKIASVLLFIALTLIFVIITEGLVSRSLLMPELIPVLTPLFIIFFLIISKLYLQYKNS